MFVFFCFNLFNYDFSIMMTIWLNHVWIDYLCVAFFSMPSHTTDQNSFLDNHSTNDYFFLRSPFFCNSDDLK